jgi:tRNA (cytidine/uridine-2'-O-)-methyltransferase
MDDRQLKRAGLDSWDEVNVRLWNSFNDLQRTQSPNTHYFFLTTKTKRAYYDVTFRQDDFLVFGRETKGLPETLLVTNIDNCITIPMHGTRSLNLATAVAIVLFEAVRQQRC